jgi:hypothetical protein
VGAATGAPLSIALVANGRWPVWSLGVLDIETQLFHSAATQLNSSSKYIAAIKHHRNIIGEENVLALTYVKAAATDA